MDLETKEVLIAEVGTHLQGIANSLNALRLAAAQPVEDEIQFSVSVGQLTGPAEYKARALAKVLERLDRVEVGMTAISEDIAEIFDYTPPAPTSEQSGD